MACYRLLEPGAPPASDEPGLELTQQRGLALGREIVGGARFRVLGDPGVDVADGLGERAEGEPFGDCAAVVGQILAVRLLGVPERERDLVLLEEAVAHPGIGRAAAPASRDAAGFQHLRHRQGLFGARRVEGPHRAALRHFHHPGGEIAGVDQLDRAVRPAGSEDLPLRAARSTQ